MDVLLWISGKIGYTGRSGGDSGRTDPQQDPQHVYGENRTSRWPGIQLERWCSHAIFYPISMPSKSKFKTVGPAKTSLESLYCVD